MSLSTLLQEEMPVMHITITWIAANIVLSFIHSPSVIFDIILEMSYLFGILSFFVCLFIANKISHSWNSMKKLRLNFDSKISIREYQKIVKKNTKLEVEKLIQSPQYKEYLKKKKDLEAKGQKPEVIMCNPETTYKIAGDISELKKLQEIFFQDDELNQ